MTLGDPNAAKANKNKMAEAAGQYIILQSVYCI